MKFGTFLRLCVATCVLIISSVIATAQLSLVYPAGGEIFYNTRDTTVRIVWTGVEDTTKVRVEYSSNSGFRWKVISDTATGFALDWNIKGYEVGAAYLVRVSQVRPPLGSDNIQYVGHGGPVYDAYWNPSNTRVVSVSANCHLWDPMVGGSVPLAILPAPTTIYTSVVWSKDSTRIAASNVDGKALVFDAKTNTLQTTVNHNNSVVKLELDPTGEYLMTQCDDFRARVYRLPATAAIGTYNPAAAILNTALSPDGFRTLVCANEAKVYNRAGGLPLSFSAHLNGVLAGAWSADGKWICTIGGDISIRLWDAVTGVESWFGQDPIQNEGVRCVVFSPDGKYVAVGMTDSTITVWNAASGALAYRLGGHKGAVRMVQFSPNSEFLASASDDDFANIYNMETGEQIRAFQHSNDVYKVRWDAAGGSVLTTSRDGTARIWRILDIPLQSDTSGSFSISPPPAASAKFTTSGGVLQIGQEITVSLKLEGASQLDLARVDSVQFVLKYDASMLHKISSSTKVRSERDSSTHKILTMEAIKLPFVNGELLNVRFQGTLGADTITSLRIVDVQQIGIGRGGILVQTESAPITVQGICRAGGNARLYNPVGVALQAFVSTEMGDGKIDVYLAESGPTTLKVFDLQGRMRYSYTPNSSEIQARFFEVSVPVSVIGNIGIISVVTATQVYATPFVLVQQ
ncbi:MAG: hypothetical protein HQ472_06425 [Ignavibacteria bacterium]|nr:hypothetical protein [Ignavibacteria bacterium]